jgi:hypothetical protein
MRSTNAEIEADRCAINFDHSELTNVVQKLGGKMFIAEETWKCSYFFKYIKAYIDLTLAL